MVSTDIRSNGKGVFIVARLPVVVLCKSCHAVKRAGQPPDLFEISLIEFYNKHVRKGCAIGCVAQLFIPI